MKYFFLFLGDYCMQEYRGDTVLWFEVIVQNYGKQREMP